MPRSTAASIALSRAALELTSGQYAACGRRRHVAGYSAAAGLQSYSCKSSGVHVVSLLPFAASVPKSGGCRMRPSYGRTVGACALRLDYVCRDHDPLRSPSHLDVPEHVGRHRSHARERAPAGRLTTFTHRRLLPR